MENTMFSWETAFKPCYLNWMNSQNLYSDLHTPDVYVIDSASTTQNK